MDDRFKRPARGDDPRRQGGESPRNAGNQSSRPRSSGDQGGGLLKRFGSSGDAGNGNTRGKRDERGSSARGPQRSQSNPRQGRDRHDDPRGHGGWDEGDEGRRPGHGDWRASDFDADELEAWDRDEVVPFELPPDPDAPRNDRGADRGVSSRRPASEWDDWQDDDWNADWGTGTWDTGWATGYQPSMEYARAGMDDDGGFWMPGRSETYEPDDDAISRSLSTLAQLGAVHAPLGRADRVRILFRRRPAAAAMLAFFLLGFMLTACAPLIPLVRLGYDAADASRRLTNLRTLVGNDPTSLMNATKLQEVQAELAAIEKDMYEINGAMNILAAPLGAVSPSVQNYRLLVRMGYDLAAAGQGGIQVAQTVLTPLQGAALGADSSSPGLTANDIQTARTTLAEAEAYVADAMSAYQQIDPNTLPSQLKPGTSLGNMLALLPTAAKAIGELKSLLDVAPAMLGIGAPAYYLVTAMDTTELRPGGGFTGNYGILTIEGGKQSKSRPLSLNDTYKLDQKYYQKGLEPYAQQLGNIPVTEVPNCQSLGPQPPAYYWWWPVRNFDPACKYGWGLRDANLSADFPTNARTMMQIVQDAGGELPGNGSLQGVIAFTPGLIKDLLKVTGPIKVPGFNTTVDANNLERTIHDYQLGSKQPQGGTDRKQFTHVLSSVMLDKLKTLGGSQLKAVVKAAQEALKAKDLQVYLADPRAELILRQLGLSSEVSTSGSDGYFVVDANDGGNKANAYVTQKQTDYVTLLPNGGAIHRLQIAVTYDKGKRTIYAGDSKLLDYSDFQRVYLPGDAQILGFAGYNPSIFAPTGCGGGFGTVITDCSPEHAIRGPVTVSDIAGRTMVGGPLLVLCGQSDSYINAEAEYNGCYYNPAPHTQTVYITWYTPQAYTAGSDGGGTYSMLVERQAGSVVNLTVYVSTAQLGKAQVNPNGTTPDLTISGDSPEARDAAYAQLLKDPKAKKVFDGPLSQNQLVSFSW